MDYEIGHQEQLAFTTEWPIEHLQKMTLDEYTNLDRETSFTYWLEKKTENSGAIWGGSSYKFGIFRRKNLESKRDDDTGKTDGKYSWYSKYGDTAAEAFEKVKGIVISIAKASSKGAFGEIDRIDFGHAMKWKIAFHYNTENLVPIFKREWLEAYAESKGLDNVRGLETSQLQALTIKQKPPQLSTLAFSHEIWQKFSTDNIYHSIEKFLRQAQTDNLKKLGFPKTFKGLDMKVSFGAGNMAKVPWIAFLAEPNTVSDGIYPVYLYFKESNVLILAYGVSETNESSNTWPKIEGVQTVKEWFQSNLSGFPERYGSSFVKAAYYLNAELDPIKMQKDLNEVIADYKKLGFTESSVNDKDEIYSGKRYWVMAPGEVAKKWDEFVKKGITGLGWEDAGDLTMYRSREEITDFLVKAYPEGSKTQKNNSLALWEFVKVMKPGDIIIPKRGASEYLGYGVVTGEYIFDENAKDYNHTRKVDWKKNGVWPEDVHRIVTKTLTDITKYPEYVDRLKRLIGIEQEAIIPSKVNYWWINANPTHWRITDFEVGQEQTYTTTNEKGNKRTRYEYFQQLKQGDLILGYASSPIKKVTAIFEVTKPIYINEDTGKEEIAFTIQKFLPDPVPIAVVLDLPEMQKSEILNNRQGSLYKLTKEEFHAVLDDDIKKEEGIEEFSEADALKDLFLESADLDRILSALKYKKNIILQGPPGTGKTFMAKLIAYSMMEEKDDSRIEMIQFHQSYSYEDFIQGFRPKEDASFKLENGVFYRFCKKAQTDPNKKYFFIIDEINRGNLSKIFGELMLLIEGDKRGAKHSVPLTYSHGLDTRFFIPSNVYLIGTMNTADRSLSIVDYALRRRFAFIDVNPNFNQKFKNYLVNEGVDEGIVDKIYSRITRLNSNIEKTIGKGFQIGHSYFCNVSDDGGDDDWYRQIIDMEVGPLLREYWFDNTEVANSEIESLLG
jgi:5-methylcytosine-specific restriction protein B